MKKYLILLLIITFQCTSNAQKSIIINLAEQVAKKKSLPYKINTVEVKTTNKEQIGYAINRKNNDAVMTILPNIHDAIKEFYDTHYQYADDGLPIDIIITQLEVKKVDTQPSIYDTLKFACTFNMIQDKEQEALYEFSGKNLVGSFEKTDELMKNYIIRFLNTSIEKFTKAYEKNKHWQKSDRESGPKVVKKVTLNQFYSADSIRCIYGYQLSTKDLNINKENKTSSPGHARMVLTYVAEAQEKNNSIQLTIHVKSFLDKNRSWIDVDKITEQWYPYQQGHFDITAAYGQKLKKAFEKKSFSAGEYKSELNKVYNDVYEEYVKLRKLYEDETMSGTITEKMTEWKRKIEKMNRE
jgi:hypothetical protein